MMSRPRILQLDRHSTLAFVMAESLSSLFLRLQAVEATQRASQLSAAGANGAALEHRKLISCGRSTSTKFCGQISAFYGTLHSASQIMEVTPVP